MNIDINDIGRLLLPRSGVELLWDIFLYLIFFLALVTMLLIPDKNMTPTLLISVVLLSAVIDKLEVFSNPKNFGVFIIHVAMFAIPFIVAGTIRVRVGKPIKAAAPAIITGVFGGLYFFIFWLVEQRV